MVRLCRRVVVRIVLELDERRARADEPPGLLAYLAHDHLRCALVRLDPPTREGPLAGGAHADEQQAPPIDDERNRLTRALGPGGEAEADVFSLALQPEDRVILCSDGGHGQLMPADVAALAAGEPQAASQALVELALRRGATDNVSAVVLRYRP